MGNSVYAQYPVWKKINHNFLFLVFFIRIMGLIKYTQIIIRITFHSSSTDQKINVECLLSF